MRRVRWGLLVLGAGLAMLTLSGCVPTGESGVSSEDARKQLDAAVEAVQTATGKNWEVEVEPGVASCSNTHQRWSATWRAVPTDSREMSNQIVVDALEKAGFEASILGPDSKTPMVGAQTDDGFGLYFSIPTDGGAAGLSVSSDCFPIED